MAGAGLMMCSQTKRPCEQISKIEKPQGLVESIFLFQQSRFSQMVVYTCKF